MSGGRSIAASQRRSECRSECVSQLAAALRSHLRQPAIQKMSADFDVVVVVS